MIQVNTAFRVVTMYWHWTADILTATAPPSRLILLDEERIRSDELYLQLARRSCGHVCHLRSSQLHKTYASKPADLFLHVHNTNEVSLSYLTCTWKVNYIINGLFQACLPTIKLQACLYKPNWICKCCCCKTWTKSKHSACSTRGGLLYLKQNYIPYNS